MSHDDGMLMEPHGVAFDHQRGLLVVADTEHHRVQVFSSDGGSFVAKFGQYGDQPGQLQYPCGVAIDYDHDRILITDCGNHRVQAFSLHDRSFVSCIGQQGSRELEFHYPQGIAIDTCHRRVVIADTENNRLVFLSLSDLSFLFAIGGDQLPLADSAQSKLVGVAIDHERERILVTDTKGHRVLVLSLVDGAFLFEFGEHGKQPGQLNTPMGVYCDTHGRIIVAEQSNSRLQAFTPEGHHISSYECASNECNTMGAYPRFVALEEYRGLMAYSTDYRVCLKQTNQWPAIAFTWHINRHRYAPPAIKQVIETLVMLRSTLIDDGSSLLSLLPNELLFEIFAFL